MQHKKAASARGDAKRAKSFKEMLMQYARGNAFIFTWCTEAWYAGHQKTRIKNYYSVLPLQKCNNFFRLGLDSKRVKIVYGRHQICVSGGRSRMAEQVFKVL